MYRLSWITTLNRKVRKLPSFVEDTPDLLRCIEERNTRGRLPDHVFPVSMDVCALYPSIPWKEGLEALERAAERKDEKVVPTSFLMRLMVLVLGTNVFEFDGELYEQKDGTAIGTRAAYDLFFLWWGSERELCDFVDFANSILPSIKVTVEFDLKNRSVNYLDMKIFIDNQGFLRTDLYRKETVKNSYLMPSSAHPSHVTGNIPSP